MWHASARPLYATWRDVALSVALRALHGVGDRNSGEWIEQGSLGTMHVRRRLTTREAAQVNPLRDIRGTTEERERMCALVADLPPAVVDVLRRAGFDMTRLAH